MGLNMFSTDKVSGADSLPTADERFGNAISSSLKSPVYRCSSFSEASMETVPECVFRETAVISPLACYPPEVLYQSREVTTM